MLKLFKINIKNSKGLRISLSLFFVLSFCRTDSQNLNREYIGAVITKEKKIILYTLHIKTSDKGTISGYSVTNQGKKSETTCLLKGHYNSSKNALHFEEYKIQDAKFKYKLEEMCFIHFDGKLFHKNENVIKGKYIGKYQDGSTCSTGQLILASKDLVLNTVDTVLKSKDTSLSEIKKELPIIQLVKKNETKKIFVDSEMIEVDIWDDHKLDNDIVEIYVNNKLVKENIVLSKQEFNIKLNTKASISIKIKAKNVGYVAPNTSKIRITDGSNTKFLFCELDVNETAEIELIKK